jgi:mycofactocin system transcriptional regulator
MAPSGTAPTRNPTHPLTTIEAIEEAALEVFAARGYDEPTVEEIAAAAGISRRTFFRYFATKADIPWGNFDALLQKMDAWFSSAPDDKPMLDVIAEGVLHFNRFHTESPSAHRQRMALIMQTPALVANAALRQVDYSRAIAAYAARRLDQPSEALAPQLVANLALGASSAAYREWLRDEKSDLVELMKRAFAMVHFEPEVPTPAKRAAARRHARKATATRR